MQAAVWKEAVYSFYGNAYGLKENIVKVMTIKSEGWCYLRNVFGLLAGSKGKHIKIFKMMKHIFSLVFHANMNHAEQCFRPCSKSQKVLFFGGQK